MRRNADVICQHTKDGQLIPLKIRVEDDDGELQSYSIRSYKPMTVGGKLVMPNEVTLKSSIWQFECKICMWGKEQIISLFYSAYDKVWYVDM